MGCDIFFPLELPSLWKFQSTHPRGVRPPEECLLSCMQNFNPRTHVGCDIFTHLPESANMHFNPRTHVGCDSGERYVSHVHRISIHAPTWGATIAKVLRISVIAFQSTHPRGVRPQYEYYGGHQALISIHAPTWGATQPRP